MQYPFYIRSSAFLCAASALLLLQACSTGKNYSEINPERAKQEVRNTNGYRQLKSVPPGKSKLVLRSVGLPNAVQFAECESENGCEKYEDIGLVANSGQGVLLPWIAKATGAANRALGGRKPYIVKLVEPDGRSIQIRGYSSDSASAAGTVSHSSCGPVFSTLTPQEGHAYVVEFQFVEDRCQQVVFDATDPDNMVPLTNDQQASAVQ